MYIQNKAIQSLFCSLLMLPSIAFCQGETFGTAIGLEVFGQCYFYPHTSVNHSPGNVALNCGGFAGFAEDATWFSFVAPAMAVDVLVVGNGSTDVNIGYDPVLVVYQSDGSTLINCSDANFGQGTSESVNLSGLTVGNTYYLWIYDWPSNGGSFEVCLSATGSPLPIKLISFEATATENSVVLNWESSDENNFDHFELQKSRNAKSFESIYLAESKYPNGHQYRFEDLQPFTGDNYYRLKMNDTDGTFSYSDIIYKDFQTYRGPFPNPSSHEFTIELPEQTFYNYTLLNTQKIEILNGYSHGSLKLPTANLEPGLYIVHMVTDNGERISKKLIKH